MSADRFGVLPRIGIRTGRLAAYRDLGVSRVMAQLTAATTDLGVLDRFREDALTAGAEHS